MARSRGYAPPGSGEFKKTSRSRTSFVVAVDPRTGRLIRGFLGLLGLAFLGHAAFGLVTGDNLPVGGYALLPAEMRHYALAKTESTVEVHGMGPFALTYVNLADDPGKRTASK